MRKGWEYKSFETCINKLPKPKQVKTSEYSSGTKYPIISQEDKLISGYYDDESYVFHIDSPVVIFGDHTRVLKYVDFDFVVGADGVKIISPKRELNAKFLLYYLQWYKIPNLGYSRHYKLLKEIKIPLPPKSTQLAIVSELDKINELIRLKKEQLKDFDNLAQSLFYEMFGDPVENEKGWEVKKLNEIVSDNCSISYGIVQPGDGVENGIPVVRPVDMTKTFVSRKGLKNTTKEISDSYKRTILKGNEILMCVRGTTGLISMATPELQGCNVTRGIAPIECGPTCDKWFVFYQILNPAIQHHIAEYTRGIALKQINMKDVRDIPLCLPPLPLQRLFAQRIEQIEREKSEVQKSIQDLETLLASRMQYWFE